MQWPFLLRYVFPQHQQVQYNRLYIFILSNNNSYQLEKEGAQDQYQPRCYGVANSVSHPILIHSLSNDVLYNKFSDRKPQVYGDESSNGPLRHYDQ